MTCQWKIPKKLKIFGINFLWFWNMNDGSKPLFSLFSILLLPPSMFLYIYSTLLAIFIVLAIDYKYIQYIKKWIYRTLTSCTCSKYLRICIGFMPRHYYVLISQHNRPLLYLVIQQYDSLVTVCSVRCSKSVSDVIMNYTYTVNHWKLTCDTFTIDVQLQCNTIISTKF